MITRQGIFLLTASVFTALLAVTLRDLYFYILTSFGWSVLAVSFFVSRLRLANVGAAREALKAVFCGEYASIKLVLKNTGHFQEGPFKLTDFLGSDFAQAESASIFIKHLNGQPLDCGYDFFSNKRGLFELGPLVLEGADLFGIFNVVRKIKSQSQLVVYPMPFNIRRLPITAGIPSFAGRGSRRAGDYEEFYGIREYRIDDGLRKIHWPSTARLGQLMVKQFQQSAVHKATILLDLEKDSFVRWDLEDSFDWAARVAASVAKYLIDKKIAVQFIAEQDKTHLLPFKSAQPHLFEIFDTLARLMPQGRMRLQEVLDTHERLIPAGSCLILIFSKSRLPIYEKLIRLSAKRVGIISIVMQGNEGQDWHRGLEELCNKVYFIKEKDLIGIENKFL